MKGNRCDVVIVGAGIGGMCVAAILSHAGLKTVLLEKSPFLGGRYTSTRYKDYLIHTGACMLMNGKKSVLWKILQEVGAAEPETQSVQRFVYRIGGRNYDSWINQKGNLRQLISAVSKDKVEAERVMSAVRHALEWREPSDTSSFKDWLLQYTGNENVHSIFQAAAVGWGGVLLDEYPAGELVRFMKQGVTEYLVPKNGLREIVDALEQVIKNHGGEILRATKATDIAVKDNVTVGVTAQRRAEKLEFESRAIVSDVGPVETIRLAKEQNFDRGYLKDVIERIRPAVGITYNIISDKPLIDFSGYFITCDTRRIQYLIDMTNLWPHWAPHNKHIVYGFTIPPSIHEYDPKRDFELTVQDINDLFPEFDRYGGQFLSLGNFSGNWPFSRSSAGFTIEPKTSIKNLYNVGDAIESPGYTGGEGVAVNAKRVAEDILTRIEAQR